MQNVLQPQMFRCCSLLIQFKDNLRWWFVPLSAAGSWKKNGSFHFHVLLEAEAASRGDQFGTLHFNQELLKEKEEEGS